MIVQYLTRNRGRNYGLPVTTQLRPRGALLLAVLLLAGAVVLTVFGGIDRWVAGLFFSPETWFLGNHEPFPTLRYATTIAAWGIGAFVLAGLIWSTVLARPFFGLSRGATLYIAAAFVLGPGLLANGIFKEHWDRARPSQTEQFGGQKRFTPPLVIADQCRTNCSFVSGEAALGFTFMTFGFVARTPARRRAGFAAGIGLGGLFGLLRIAEGGHFLSDVYFAGLFMALVSWALHRWFAARGWL